MADDGGLTGFLNPQTDESGDPKTISVKGTTYTLVQTANPVNWGRLGTAIVVSGIATVSITLQEMVISTFDAVKRLLQGATSWIGGVEYVPSITVPRRYEGDVTDLPGEWTGSGLIGELYLPFLQWYRNELWARSIESFGVFGYFVALGITLLALFILVRGLQTAGQKLAGGRA